TTTASAPDTSVSAQLDGTSITSDVSSATTPPGDSAPFGDGAPVQVVPTPVPRARERRTGRVGAIVGVSVGALLLLCVLGAGVWFVLHRRSLPVRPTNTNANTPVVVAPDAQQQAQAKVTEAQGLLSAGDPVGATARLREAIALDPTNAEAHRQLAQLLLESGARQTAIEELRAVTRLEPNDKDAWLQLAEAQLAEKLYADAADSYHMLLNISDEARADERLQLAYADAIRLAGRAAEASTLYTKLVTSPLPDVARASKQRLAELNAADEATETPRTQNTNEA